MALIISGKTKCPLCGEVIAAGQRLVATSPFIEDPNHALWRFSDAAIHYDCFQSWERREEFVTEFNKGNGRIVWGNGKRHYMQPDGTIVIVEAGSNGGSCA